MKVFRFETMDHDGIWCPSKPENRLKQNASRRAAQALRSCDMQFDNPGLDYHEYEDRPTISFVEFMDDRIPHPTKDSWDVSRSMMFLFLDRKTSRFAFNRMETIHDVIGLNYWELPKEQIHDQYEFVVRKNFFALWEYDIPTDRILAQTESQMMFQWDESLKPVRMFETLRG